MPAAAAARPGRRHAPWPAKWVVLQLIIQPAAWQGDVRAGHQRRACRRRQGVAARCAAQAACGGSSRCRARTDSLNLCLVHAKGGLDGWRIQAKAVEQPATSLHQSDTAKGPMCVGDSSARRQLPQLSSPPPTRMPPAPPIGWTAAPHQTAAAAVGPCCPGLTVIPACVSECDAQPSALLMKGYVQPAAHQQSTDNRPLPAAQPRDERRNQLSPSPQDYCDLHASCQRQAVRPASCSCLARPSSSRARTAANGSSGRDAGAATGIGRAQAAPHSVNGLGEWAAAAGAVCRRDSSSCWSAWRATWRGPIGLRPRREPSSAGSPAAGHFRRRNRLTRQLRPGDPAGARQRAPQRPGK